MRNKFKELLLTIIVIGKWYKILSLNLLLINKY